LVRGAPPDLNLQRERALHALLVDLAAARLIRSAHDVSEGGLAVTLAECSFGTASVGADISLEPTVNLDGPADIAHLFGESASVVVVSLQPHVVTDVLQRAALHGVPARVVGETGGNRLRIAVGGRVVVDVSQRDAESAWASALERVFTRKVA
jgi:phosphoribosylformylglycinamidine synthase